MATKKLCTFCGPPLCLLLIISFAYVEAAPKGSLVTYLPGFRATFPSNHHAGYVSFDDKNLFYYFVVSERNPSKDPVVLWLNGGPGCSSFDGYVYEHGPFNFQEEKPKGSLPSLVLNPYSWSKVSNIIYLDSPCGVGLSYSKNTSKYTTSDLQTAADTHTFLLKLYQPYNLQNKQTRVWVSQAHVLMPNNLLAWEAEKRYRFSTRNGAKGWQRRVNLSSLVCVAKMKMQMEDK